LDLKDSPYMIVKNENDKMLVKEGAYYFMNGAAQDVLEK
jgi:hypothetical protein